MFSNQSIGLILRHHQEQQLKFQQQQQLLNQWFQKEEQLPPLPSQQTSQDSLLLKDGSCQWPGCEKSQFANKGTFQQHLASEHSLSQCSAAQVH